MKRFASILFVFLFLAGSGVGSTHAQVLGTLATVSISLSPEHPQPGQQVTATVSVASEDVRAATIVWLLNSALEEQGPGQTTFTFTAGSVNTSQTIGVLVKTRSGQTLSKTLTIRPSQVTLVWEADTYTPAFYRGRALYSSGSTIRVEAIPYFVNIQGRRYDASELIYTWSRNITVLGNQSGVGRSSLVTQGPKFFGTDIISVEVSTPDGTQVARSAAQIRTIDPTVTLYERDPLLGTLYFRAITSSYTFGGSSQFEVQAVPYFMDAKNENSDALQYSWRVNNTSVAGLREAPSILNIRLDSEEDIDTRINVVIDHARHLLQTAKGSLRVSFEGSARNSLFGL